MKITKLDRRHSGKMAFDYYVSPTETDRWRNPMKIHEWRVWCWETFGPGSERDVAVRLHMNGRPLKWAWDTDNGNCRLYLTEDDLVIFKLKWA
jgi:hypothetical protein